MDKKQFKILIIVAVLLMFMTMMNTCNSCSTKRQIINLKKQVDSVKTKLEKIPNVDYMNNLKNDVNIFFQIEGFRISKRILYDNNAIIRTIVRPDDRMNEYDMEIQKLQKNDKKS